MLSILPQRNNASNLDEKIDSLVIHHDLKRISPRRPNGEYRRLRQVWEAPRYPIYGGDQSQGLACLPLE